MPSLSVLKVPLALLLSLALLLPVSLSTNHGESSALPSATIVQPAADRSIVTFDSMSFQLNCTGNGVLKWYRYNGTHSEPLYNSSELIDIDNSTSVLVLTIVNVTEGVDASRDGIEYFCTANNSLGVARSRTMMALYSFFGGFSFDNTSNSSIIVRIGEAVAFPCNISTSLPQPNIVWYKDDQPIQLSPLADDSKYIALNEYLVIYDLTSDDISSSYRCGVDNVEITRSVNSTYSYTLTENATLSDGFIIYRGPVTPKVVRPNETPVLFYYIVATNDNTARGTIIETLDLAQQPDNTDTHLLRIAIPNEGTDRSITISARDRATTLAETSTIVGFTVAEPLTILQTPSIITADNDTLQLFSIFEAESINFTCAANGTGVSLSWYFNGRKLPNVNGNTLELTNVTTDNAGVYQCEWTTTFDDEYNQATWALSIRTPIQPRDFTFTSTNIVDNSTIVPIGTNVVLTLTFTADSLPNVHWLFRSNDGNTTRLNLTDNSRYESSGPILVPDTASTYTVNLTINNVTLEVSGFYFAAIDDMRTPSTNSSEWFVSQTVPNKIISFDIISNLCLLDNVTTELVCVVQGLPTPTVRFLHRNNEILPDDHVTNFLTAETRNILRITADNADDGGTYTCRSMLESDVKREDRDAEYCTKPVITSLNPNPSIGTIGEQFSLDCNVESVPLSAIVISWYKNGRELSSNDSDVPYAIENAGVRLFINSLTESDRGTYLCVASNNLIPGVAVNDSFVLTVMESSPTPDPTTLPIIVGGAVGGVVVLALLLIAIVILCCCIVRAKKSGNYSTKAYLSKDFTDGRGNVDRDSDEEDRGHEEPEAFQPQYESLPALRPTQPPQYKPSPAYNQGYSISDDMEMIKMPIPPDGDFDYIPPPPAQQGYYPRHDMGGTMGGDVPHGSSNMALQARFDDFMSDDGQFV